MQRCKPTLLRNDCSLKRLQCTLPYLEARGQAQEGQHQLEAVEAAQQNSPRVEDSLARLNYQLDSEAAVNEQINHEYTMSYVYHAMSNYFSRDNVGEMPTAKP